MINKRNIVGAGIVLSVLMTLLCGCQALEKKQQVGAVAELNGQYLYRSTLDSLTLGLNSEDSLRVVQLFIRQWAQDILLYDNSTARTHREIEQMVSEYRRTLYAQAYEDRLVERRMPKSIPDSSVQAIYDRMPDRFILDESIVKGVLLVVPNDAPNLSKVKQWLLKIGTERQERKERKNSKATNVLDDIEKYVYQNASGYELFTDQWTTVTALTRQMPVERADLETKLKYGNRIEISDSTQTFILQVTEKHMRGEKMPVEYARPQIEKIILNARRVEFLRKERERLYNDAVQEKKTKFFDI
jgi:hypothetical protein